MSNARVQKRQLEKARQERAAAKRDRRATKGTGDDASPSEDGDGSPVSSEAEVLAALAALHAQYADEQISLDDFEVARAELVDRLHVT